MIQHPSAFINPEHTLIIRQQAEEAEKLGRLTNQQLQLAYQQQWFNISVPAAYGGLQMSLPDIVRLQEALSWCDGSMGWVITLCSGAGWFGGFIQPGNAATIFNTKEVCIAGSGATTGTAELTNDGYIINGKWHYASGVHHATHITVNCVITKDGQPLKDVYDNALIHPFILDKSDVQLLPGWKYMGMIATGSDAYEINSVHVEKNARFSIHAADAYINDKLYHYPFLQMAYATLGINLSGMAVHFMDQCKAIFEQRQGSNAAAKQHSKAMNDLLAEKVAMQNTLRNDFYTALHQSWDNETDKLLLDKVSKLSYHLANASRSIVDILFPYCGLKAAAPGSEINRIWRDIHTASQHALLTFAP